MADYRLINSGQNQRREYLSLNHSPLFQNLPQRDTAQEQKKSYYDFLHEKLAQLLAFYFPVEFSDHNNIIKLKAENLSHQEPEISEEEARVNSFTWSYKVFFNLVADWQCHAIQIPLKEKELEKNISQWVEESFKIGNFSLQKKSAKNWEVKEKKATTLINLEIKEQHQDYLLVAFRYQQVKEILFCHLPKINNQGNFIINGHDKVVVFQSVRAPSIYYFANNEQKYYGEIIPAKGPWISFFYNYSSQQVELKFLNSGRIISLWEVLKIFDVPAKTVSLLFNDEDLNTNNDYASAKKVETSSDLPKFLFTEKNSYFEFGELGRKKFNHKMLIWPRLVGQVLAEDITDKKGKIILSKNSILTLANIEKLQGFFVQEKINTCSLPFATNEISWVKIKSPLNPDKVITVVGVTQELSENKTYFDLADLVCTISYYLNLRQGFGKSEKEEDKDKLSNQVIRRVGDLLRNIFDNKLGGFLHQDMARKYLANISQLRKTDLAKIPNLKDFDNLLKGFFNTSPLVQLQNQNNPLAEISYTRKVSVLGLGGFNADNTTLAARDVNESHYGRYGLMATQEGKNFGLIHNLTLGAEINKYGQIVAPYYRVQAGVIKSQLVYLTSEEEENHYISHCNIKINQVNKIMEAEVVARYQGLLVKVPREKIDYIDSSFFHLTSVEEAVGPFSPYDDATRKLMSSNMQRGAISPLKNQEPLIASGVESILYQNSALVVRATEEGQVEYVDSKKIIVQEKVYNLTQLLVSNKNILNFLIPLVKKGDKVVKGQIIASGYYANNGELSLGYNLRVAYLSYHHNYEDAIIVSDRLVKNDIFTYVFAKKYTITRYNTAYGPEIFTDNSPHPEKIKFPHLDKEGIVKIGSEVKENNVLVRKLTPEPSRQESEEELLLLKILGGKGQRFADSSLYLPKGEKGIVYKIEREELTGKDELERVKIYVAHERKIEDGDKLTTRYGNKGIVKVLPEVDMPFDEHGPFDIIFNPLGVPTRMNMGQLLEALLAEAAFKLNTKLLVRPFSTISLATIKDIAQEAGIKNLGNKKLWDGRTGLPFEQDVYTGRIYTMLLNHKAIDKLHARATGPYSLIYQQPLKGRKRDGGQRVGEMEGWCLEAHGVSKILMRIYGNDDISKRRELQNYLLFGNRKLDLRYNRSESFNLVIQYLRGMGFDISANDYQGREIDFYKYFSK